MPEPEFEIIKGHCPTCGPSRNADVVASHTDSWDDREAMMWGSKKWRVLMCRGCSVTFVQTSETFSEETHHYQDADGEWQEELNERVSHWPSPLKRAEPDWSKQLSPFDSILGALFEDIYGCLNADLTVPAAVAMRTAFDRASELLGIDSALTFEKKLQGLVNDGRIAPDEKATLSALIDGGSAAVHRGWRPKAAELETMAQLTESFLQRTFILGTAAEALKSSIPPRPAKKAVAKKANKPRAEKGGL